LGYITVKGVIANPFSKDLKMGIEFIVGTGAIYSIIPRYVAEALQLKEIEKRRFWFASGVVVEYPVAKAYIVEGKGVTSLVVIGSEGTISLLGVATPELLGFR